MKCFGFILLVLTGLLIAGCGRLTVGAAAPPPAATGAPAAPEPSATPSPGWTAAANLPTLTTTIAPAFTPTAVSTLTPTLIAGPAETMSPVAPPNGGTYQGTWVFQSPDGSRFGVNSGGIDSIWVKIAVSYRVIDPGTGAAAAPASCAAASRADYITQELALINAARTSAGLGALTLQPQLSAAAQVHSVDMACSSRLDHTGTDGSTWYTRVKAQGYDYVYASENIFAGSPDFGGDPPGAFDWWWKSKIHHDNLMNPKITQIGIGYAFVPSSQYGGYYTLDFGLPKE